jgi:hypothetical protein
MRSLSNELSRLPQLPIPELLARYAEVFGETTNTRNKPWLVRRIAWRLQANAHGGLSDHARQRAEELANDADLRKNPPRKQDPGTETTTTTHSPQRIDSRLPIPGTILTREYKGQSIEVHVLAQGFEYAGTVYKSLSAVAKVITGTHLNGFRFFQLTEETR